MPSGRYPEPCSFLSRTWNGYRPVLGSRHLQLPNPSELPKLPGSTNTICQVSKKEKKTKEGDNGQVAGAWRPDYLRGAGDKILAASLEAVSSDGVLDKPGGQLTTSCRGGNLKEISVRPR